jgi:hypothetical protein
MTLKFVLVAVASTALVALGQQKTQSVTLSDPSPVQLAALFSQADLVAFITIESGDAEHYNAAVYKALVTKSYKGAKAEQRIYFGPFVSYGIGSEYLVFLKQTDKHLVDLWDRAKSNGPFDSSQPYYRVMYDGYSAMPVDYECIFEGKDNDKCDYGVGFNTYQVELPRTLKTFPINVGDFPADKKSVRRGAVERELSLLAGNRP